IQIEENLERFLLRVSDLCYLCNLWLRTLLSRSGPFDRLSPKLAMSNIRVLALVVLVLLSADWSIISAAQQLVLTHVTVIDMTGAAPRENMTVIIEGQKIISIASSKETSPSTDALVVDASGKYLIPGLWDMHLHTVYDSAKDTETTLFPLLIANGITGTRNPGSSLSIG